MSTKDNTKTYSSKQENMVADFLDWEVVAGSGAAACYPGDVISDMWLGECKTHTKAGHKIFFDRNVWEKIKEEAYVKHRRPVLITDDGTQWARNTWCVCLKNHLEMEDVVVSPMIKGVNKNISFSGEDQKISAKTLLRTRSALPVFSCKWGKDDVIICELYVFAQLRGE